MASLRVIHAMKVFGLATAMISLSSGLVGCNILKRFAKIEKQGAIAYSEATGASGFSFNRVTEDAAKEEAMKKCGDSCTVALTWKKGCGALARSDSDMKVFGAKTASSRLTAEGAAKANCMSKGAGFCKVVAWACNGK
jgi:hypothetical protein